MKKYEELTKEEKKAVKEEFKKTSFGSFSFYSAVYGNIIGLLALPLIVDSIVNAVNKGFNFGIIFIIIVVVLDEILYNKNKKMIKEYYELKNK